MSVIHLATTTITSTSRSCAALISPPSQEPGKIIVVDNREVVALMSHMTFFTLYKHSKNVHGHFSEIHEYFFKMSHTCFLPMEFFYHCINIF